VLLGLVLSLPGPPLGPLFGFEGPGLLHHWLEPVFHPGLEILHHEPAEYALFGIDGALIGASVAVAVIGMITAWKLFGVNLGSIRWRPNPERVRSLTARVPFLYRASLNKWWFDDLNHLIFMVIGGRVAAFLWWFDRRVVDDTVNDVATTTVGAGSSLRRVQTGRVQNYALGIAFGLIVMAGSFLVLAVR
jgi:NADH:ubiquinone oxidoreductase subunit 5 (subunit L)/multisubunit Na+/H+ antiporter MnhA subunit